MRKLMFLSFILWPTLLTCVYLTELAQAEEKATGKSPPGSLYIEAYPPVLSVEASFSEPSGNDSLDAREQGIIRIRVENTGRGDANNLRLRLTPLTEAAHLDFATSDTIDHIASGSSETLEIPISAGEAVASGSVRLRVEVMEPTFGADAVPVVFTFKTREMIPDVEVDIPETGTRNPDAIAVVIGNRDYEHPDVPPVDFAIRDATVVKEYLIKTLGYREGNIIFVENATQAKFHAIFGTREDHRGKLFNYVRPDQSDVFVYYSGHGAPDPEGKKGYFVPVDCDPAMVKLNGYSLDVFYHNLSRLPARSITVVTDACFSGASEKGMLLKDISPVFIHIENPLMASDKAVVFSSATGDQVSSWYPDKKHSLFTYYFLKGLKGEADSNQDHQITVAEMDAFTGENVPYMARRLHNREQTPQVAGQDRERVLVRF